MNNFLLDQDYSAHFLNVRNYVDAHVRKQALELTQMLASSFHIHGLEPCKNKQGKPYGRGYINHRCTRWIATNQSTIMYGLSLLNAIVEEYEYRFGKVHDADRCLHEFLEQLDEIEAKVPTGDLPPVISACGDVINAFDIPVYERYRIHYIWDKRTFYQWTKRQPPKWLKETFYSDLCQQLLKDSPINPKRLEYKKAPVTIEYADLDVFKTKFIDNL